MIDSSRDILFDHPRNCDKSSSISSSSISNSPIVDLSQQTSRTNSPTNIQFIDDWSEKTLTSTYSDIVELDRTLIQCSTVFNLERSLTEQFKSNSVGNDLTSDKDKTLQSKIDYHPSKRKIK